MTTLTRVGIAGTGICVPEREVTNDDLARIVDTNDEWIRQRTGIGARRWIEDGRQNSELCVAAARQALAEAGLRPEDLDLIVVATVSADHVFPSVACLVQTALGATNAGAFDVNAACSGFLTALHTAEAFVASGKARRVLAIGAEVLSRMLDKSDRSSVILFGDGAGAAVVTSLEESGGRGEILRSTLGADGSGFDLIWLPQGGTASFPGSETYDAGDHCIRLKGRDVYRFAVTKMTEMSRWALEGHELDELGVLVPHQVNMRIIEASLERLGWPRELVFTNIEKYGNTSAASVPIALHEARDAGRVVEGKLVLLVAFGAGLTWGATLIRW